MIKISNDSPFEIYQTHTRKESVLRETRSPLEMTQNSFKITNPISGLARSGVDRLDDDEGVKEIAGDHIGHEGRILILEHNGHDIVADVPFSLNLKRLAQILLFVKFFDSICIKIRT